MNCKQVNVICCRRVCFVWNQYYCDARRITTYIENVIYSMRDFSITFPRFVCANWVERIRITPKLEHIYCVFLWSTIHLLTNQYHILKKSHIHFIRTFGSTAESIFVWTSHLLIISQTFAVTISIARRHAASQCSL